MKRKLVNSHKLISRKTLKKIIRLRNWVLEVLPIIDLYNQVGNLPLTRENDDFIEYLEDEN
ncbi:hypothetical protein [Bacillus thuringiensis]|uniref:hypothetical protein n=1 Tax=Bacillus thuringiensis TaxID=1428 RepID=UPI003BF9095C